jgi:hypothetical protein
MQGGHRGAARQECRQRVGPARQRPRE